jgi:radical SAM superfamily enzyme YgiQ (UPF0313 family)
VRVLLISPNTERVNMPTLPLGLSLVAAAARRAGHETRFLDLLAAPDPAAAVRNACGEFSPQAIGISIRNIDDQNMDRPRLLVEPVREIVAACQAASQATIVLGGAGFSIFPDAALDYLRADVGICGEGEAAFLSLLDRLQRGVDPWGLPGVHVAGRDAPPPKTHIEDLDALPLPGDELWSSADPGNPEIWVPVQTRRGCPLDCSYCSTPDLEGRALRSRSPHRIAEHVARASEAGFRRFYFVDNTFNLPSSYALELSRRLAALHLDIAWRSILYPRDVPEDLAVALAEAGCVEVSLGFESGSPTVLRAMNKRFEPEEVRGVSRRLAAHGIRRLGFLLLGGPGETRESAVESMDFADSLDLETLHVSVGIRIYPRTALARLAVEEGLLSPDDDLLRPRFYVRPGLAEVVREEVARRYGPEAIGRPIARR